MAENPDANAEQSIEVAIINRVRPYYSSESDRAAIDEYEQHVTDTKDTVPYPMICKFFNQTNKNVDVIWCKDGKQDQYYNTLPPKTHTTIRTFSTHPWIFRNSEDGTLHFVRNLNTYLYIPYKDPKKGLVTFGENQRLPLTLIFIGQKVDTLRDICSKFLQKYMNPRKITELNLPNSMIQDLIENVINRISYQHNLEVDGENVIIEEMGKRQEAINNIKFLKECYDNLTQEEFHIDLRVLRKRKLEEVSDNEEDRE